MADSKVDLGAGSPDRGTFKVGAFEITPRFFGEGSRTSRNFPIDLPDDDGNIEQTMDQFQGKFGLDFRTGDTEFGGHVTECEHGGFDGAGQRSSDAQVEVAAFLFHLLSQRRRLRLPSTTGKAVVPQAVAPTVERKQGRRQRWSWRCGRAGLRGCG